MNVPKEIPTSSQMICLLVSHTIELDFELRARTRASPGKQAVRLPKVKVQSTKHSSDFYPHPWQHARLPFDLGSNFADTRRAHSLIKPSAFGSAERSSAETFRFTARSFA